MTAAASEPPVAQLPPRALPPGVTAGGEIGSYQAPDGARLRYQLVAAARARHQLLYLHGIESHGGWFLPAAFALRERGCTTWLLDRRGSGLNRDVDMAGALSAAMLLLADVRAMRTHIGDPPLHLVGLSWGGKLAMAAALAQPEGVRSLILITPGLRSHVDLSWRQKAALLVDLARGGRGRFELPIRPEMFTGAAPYLDFIRRDPWRRTQVSARLLSASRALDSTIRRQIAGLQPPVLLFLAGHDQIIDNEGVLRLLAPLRSGQVRVRRYEQATHSIQLEQTMPMVDDVVHFLAEQASR